MRFSVIIPLYNKASYVAKAIGSVLSQTVTDYELIIVDDGSRDKSADVALQAIRGYEKCRLIRQDNAGVSMARNNGAAVSMGDYLCFLDADDWWEPTFLEEVEKLIVEFPAAGIYGTNYTIVNEAKHKTHVAPIGVEHGFEKGYINYCQVYAKTLAMPLWTGAVCVPRLVFESVGGFNSQLKMGEDFDLWIRIFLHYKVVFLNKALSNYNQDVDAGSRAIGSLPPPKFQFAFRADYLKRYMDSIPEIKYVVEFVQIVCLKDYYLSRIYHDDAKRVLEEIDMKSHISMAYANYLRYPIWCVRLNVRLYRLLVKIRYGK